MSRNSYVKYVSIVIVILFIMVVFMPLASNNQDQTVAAQQPSGTTTPIKHVVVLYFENHSFDNLFGIYPYNNYTDNASLSTNLSTPVNILGNSTLLSMLQEVPNGVFYTKDPNEGYVPYHIDFNHGKLNGFVNGSGPQALSYYSASQAAPLWDLGEEYGLGDNFFAPSLSESAPHHLELVAGYSPVINDYGPPPYIPFNDSIFGELNNYNISYGVYLNSTAYHCASWDFLYGHSHYSSHLQSWNNFLNETANNTLPSVSYLFSQGTGKSMGPPNLILNGEMLLLYVINAIERSPEWNSTAIFITTDGSGGYYDQVVPPVLDGQQLGFRNLFLVVSPYAKEDYISNTEMMVTSILGFIDYNWKIPALNTMVADTNLPLDLFNFSQERSPIYFNQSEGFPVPTNIHFKLVTDTANDNYSSLFPMEPQIPFNELGYNRTGSSNITLASLHSKIFVTDEHGYTPFYESVWFYSMLIIGEMVMIGLIVYRHKYSGGKNNEK